MNGLSQGVFSIASLIPTTNLLLLCVTHELYCIECIAWVYDSFENSLTLKLLVADLTKIK